jgi:hypothetical protein
MIVHINKLNAILYLYTLKANYTYVLNNKNCAFSWNYTNVIS